MFAGNPEEFSTDWRRSKTLIVVEIKSPAPEIGAFFAMRK
jgi:hypothetical protein